MTNEYAMSAEETATERIEKKLDHIETDLYGISERAVKTETSMTYIKWIAIAGFSISIGATAYLNQKQSVRLDRIEDGFANHRNAICQCEEAK